MTRLWVAGLAAIATALAAAACFTVSGDWTKGGGAGADGASDAGEEDGSSEDSPASDASDAGTGYHDFKDAALWQGVDLHTINHDADGFLSAAFDGRMLYLSPGPGKSLGLVVSYDTRQPFGVGASYSSWYLSKTSSPSAGAFGGAAFDGRYVYFVPNGGGSPDGVVVRYDTQAPFGADGGLALFDMVASDVSPTPPGPSAANFVGASIVPDAGGASYLYFASSAASGLVVRYGLGQPFDAGGSYQATPEAMVDPGPFAGAVFDGQFVYFVPNGTGQVMRIDPRDFSSPSSYVPFDLTQVNPSASKFSGATFDGRYLYYVPNANGVAIQYDTTKPFAMKSSYQFFDLRQFLGFATPPEPASWAGAAFDGRYVYMAPSDSGFAVRYDTQATGPVPFTAMASWEYFDLTKPFGAVKGYSGAAFDGRYVYLVPGATSVLVRFDARTPPAMPVPLTGSFF